MRILFLLVLVILFTGSCKFENNDVSYTLFSKDKKDSLLYEKVSINHDEWIENKVYYSSDGEELHNRYLIKDDTIFFVFKSKENKKILIPFFRTNKLRDSMYVNVFVSETELYFPMSFYTIVNYNPDKKLFYIYKTQNSSHPDKEYYIYNENFELILERKEYYSSEPMEYEK